MESGVEGERGSMLLRCASQSSLDESSQRPMTTVSPLTSHATELLSELQQLHKDRVLCDIVLMAGIKEQSDGDKNTEEEKCYVPAHRVILAASSNYFRAMFTSFQEKNCTTVTIQNVSHDALKAVVDYIYSPSSLSVNEDNVQSLLSAASLLAVSGARAVCCNFMQQRLCADNALGVRSFAEVNGCSELAATAQRFLDNHFEEVCAGDEFLTLDVKEVCRLLSSDTLTVKGEESVLEAALQWVAAGERTQHLTEVMEAVRLPLVPRAKLLAKSRSPPLINGPLRVKDLLIEALSYHLLKPEERVASNLQRARPRKPHTSPKLLLVAGGQAPKAVRAVEVYNPAESRWISGLDLPSRRCRAGMAEVDGLLYIVGGFNGTLRVRTVDIYNPVTGHWTPGPSMHARRSTLGVAVIGSVIYAVGGFDGTTGLSSVEALNTRTGIWRQLANMSVRRSSVGVATIGGKLYAVGGYDGASRQCLASVEVYDPPSDTWSPCPSMSCRRSGAGVGAIGDVLYAVGGHDGPAVRRCAESWTPGDPEGQWKNIATMKAPRRNAAVCAVGGRLMVLGGDDGACNLSSGEVFDPEEDAWSPVADMSLGRSYAACSLVSNSESS